jgi:hypothetical protein
MVNIILFTRFAREFLLFVFLIILFILKKNLYIRVFYKNLLLIIFSIVYTNLINKIVISVLVLLLNIILIDSNFLFQKIYS